MITILLCLADSIAVCNGDGIRAWYSLYKIVVEIVNVIILKLYYNICTFVIATPNPYIWLGRWFSTNCDIFSCFVFIWACSGLIKPHTTCLGADWLDDLCVHSFGLDLGKRLVTRLLQPQHADCWGSPSSHPPPHPPLPLSPPPPPSGFLTSLIHTSLWSVIAVWKEEVFVYIGTFSVHS